MQGDYRELERYVVRTNAWLDQFRMEIDSYPEKLEAADALSHVAHLTVELAKHEKDPLRKLTYSCMVDGLMGAAVRFAEQDLKANGG